MRVWSAKAQLAPFPAEASASALKSNRGAEAAASTEKGRKLRLRTPYDIPRVTATSQPASQWLM